ncbi:MAG: hypothetical protein K0V04_13270 [Deltaproteobacteria bacterium]|nr:hypothetical protein [Deltaproteobacteria bacterium]
MTTSLIQKKLDWSVRLGLGSLLAFGLATACDSSVQDEGSDDRFSQSPVDGGNGAGPGAGNSGGNSGPNAEPVCVLDDDAVCECVAGDPQGIVAPSNSDEVACDLTYTETCEIIDGIEVCENEWVEGEYMCGDFADDFCDACEDNGIPSWKMVFGCGYYRNIHWCLGYKKVFYHAANIVEVDYPGPLRKFCFIEPQNNDEVVCWIDDEDPSDDLPPHVVDGLHDYYDGWGWQDCIDDGWDEVFDIY